MAAEAGTPICIDNGSHTMKCGFAGDSEPRSVFSTIVGRPKASMAGGFGKKIYVADEAVAKRGILKLSGPIEHGIITNWDDMQSLWSYIYENELHLRTEEHPVMISDAPFTTNEARGRMAQIFFESFSTPAWHVANQSVLSLYASGLTTGLVLDTGYDTTHSVPIFEGTVLTDAVYRLELGGKQLSGHLQDLLAESGHLLGSTKSVVSSMSICKEHLCFTALNFSEECANADSNDDLERHFELPDGSMISVTEERFKTPEALFNPGLCRINQQGIHRIALASILKTDEELHASLFESIVLSGGSTMFPNTPERMQIEMDSLAEPHDGMKAHIVAPSKRKYSVWLGGSILSALDSFDDEWIFRQDWEESGESIIHRKCTSGGDWPDHIQILETKGIAPPPLMVPKIQRPPPSPTHTPSDSGRNSSKLSANAFSPTHRPPPSPIVAQRATFKREERKETGKGNGNSNGGGGYMVKKLKEENARLKKELDEARKEIAALKSQLKQKSRASSKMKAPVFQKGNAKRAGSVPPPVPSSVSSGGGGGGPPPIPHGAAQGDTPVESWDKRRVEEWVNKSLPKKYQWHFKGIMKKHSIDSGSKLIDLKGKDLSQYGIRSKPVCDGIQEHLALL